MTDTLEEHNGTVSIGGRTITNLRFANDIAGLAGKEQELAKLVEQLDTTSAANDQQYQRHQYRHQSQWRETWNCQELQVPWVIRIR